MAESDSEDSELEWTFSDGTTDEDEDMPMKELQAKLRGWCRKEAFDPIPPAPPNDENTNTTENDPFTLFSQYFDGSLYIRMAECTNQRYFLMKGKSLGLTEKHIKQFLAINIVMSYLKFPRIKMYWQAKTRVPCIADTMPRERFFKIRSNLKLVDDGAFSEEDKAECKLWKIWPLVRKVRDGCLKNPRGFEACVSEQMIPFYGQSSFEQFVKAEPKTCGIKNYICTAPDGLPLDFFIYEGKGSTIFDNVHLDMGGRAVLKLMATMKPGMVIYMGRHFTSEPLLERLYADHECQGTGIVKKCRIPRGAIFSSDYEMKKKGRGSSEQNASIDGQLAVVKWFDHKPVTMMSSFEGLNPIEKCRRWCRRSKKHIDVPRPSIVKKYNAKMVGVNFLDRSISYYRISAKTKKWTVRAIFHFLDFALAAAWIALRRYEKRTEVRQKELTDFYMFREKIADILFFAAPTGALAGIKEEPKTTRIQPHPSDAKRTSANHLPFKTGGYHRCRFPKCRSPKCQIMCVTCGVYLCLNRNRNCFKVYHEIPSIKSFN